MPRTAGKTNYKNDVLLNIISLVMPSGQVGWETVAQRYKETLNEADVRPYEDIRRHFQEKLCNRGLKPTGISSKTVAIERAQNIQAEINRRNAFGAIGTAPDSGMNYNNNITTNIVI